MSWVPPFFACGECGGEIGRWPVVNLLRQEVLDWRHRSAPAGVGEHRAILGTPVASLPPLHLAAVVPEEPEPAPEVPAPEVPARPATHDELPTSARSLDALADQHGWAVEAWYMRGPRPDHRWREWRITEVIVLRMVRDGHGIVATWERQDGAAWAFEDGFSLTHHVAPVSSPEIRAILKFPRALCDTCGEPPALHSADGVCHADPDTDN